jgi:hypothetical protein
MLMTVINSSVFFSSERSAGAVLTFLGLGWCFANATALPLFAAHSGPRIPS